MAAIALRTRSFLHGNHAPTLKRRFTALGWQFQPVLTKFTTDDEYQNHFKTWKLQKFEPAEKEISRIGFVAMKPQDWLRIFHNLFDNPNLIPPTTGDVESFKMFSALWSAVEDAVDDEIVPTTFIASEPIPPEDDQVIKDVADWGYQNRNTVTSESLSTLTQLRDLYSRTPRKNLLLLVSVATILSGAALHLAYHNFAVITSTCKELAKEALFAFWSQIVIPVLKDAIFQRKGFRGLLGS